MNIQIKNNKAQIWVETAIYTLIGLVIISVVLSAALPQIDKMKDRNIIKQTAIALEDLDSKIVDVQQSPLNLRIAKLSISKGRIEINPNEGIETVTFVLEGSRLMLSEPGKQVNEGGMILLTTQTGKKYDLTLTKNYSGKLDFSTEGDQSQIKVLHASTVPYIIYIENMGDNVYSEPTHIDIRSE